ncbi:MAG TPA: TonB-dependent receptor, partial [Bryobacteraceae bacterium]|nr:TonB-dependent receptor [Bryobacteraceae bacterium]
VTRFVDEIPTTAQVKHTFVARPNLVNQISYGLSRFWIPITNSTIDGDWMTKAGISGLPAGEAASSFPEITFSGPNSITGWRGTNARAFTEAINDFTFQDNAQWTRGKHSVTFGVQVQWNQANEKTDAYGSLATWNFSNTQTAGFSPTGTLMTSTGNSYASYLLGALNSAGVTQDSVVGSGGRYKTFSWWMQDNFKVSPKLTLNLGLRHDIWLPYVEVQDRESFFNPALPNPAAGGYRGILMFMGNGPDSCGCRTTIDTDYKLFGPRIGINYALTSKTVIRAGYAIMYTHRGGVGGRGNARTGTGTLGFSASPSFVSPDSGITPAFYWDQGVPSYDKPPFLDPTLGTGFNGSGKAPSTMTYGDPEIGGRPPRYQNWNFGFERALTQTLNLGVNYVGSNGHFLSGGGRGIWSDQINPKYLALGNLLQATATPANIAAANAVIPGIGLPFAGFTGSIAQMLRPFPQYQGITDAWGDVANSNYNSLQVTLNKRLSHRLVFNSNYVWSKAFTDDTATTGSASARSAYNWKTEKAQQIDPSNTINVLLVYSLPSRKGQRLGLLTGGWQISGITTYRSGQLLNTFLANCNTPNAGSCYADYNRGFTGPARIGGDYGSGDVKGAAVYLDKNAFKSPAAFTYGDTPRTGAYGLRGPGNSNQSVSLRREFAVREGWKLSLQADALNVFNWVRFGNPVVDTTSASFGKIISVANSPRVVQIVGRFNF